MSRTRLTTEAQTVYADRKVWLAELGFASYAAYLRSSLWKGIRAKVLEGGPKCEFCSAPATQVHHSSYWPSVLRGESLKPLHPVCSRCHKYGEFTPAGPMAWKVSPKKATAKMKERTKKLDFSEAVKEAIRTNADPKSVTRKVWSRIPWETRARMIANRTGRFGEYMAVWRSSPSRSERKYRLVGLFGPRVLG